MTITWLIAVKLDNYSIVDISWSFNFTFIVLLLYFLRAGAINPIFALMVVLAAVWSGRLGIHLLIRILSHLDKEDGRYLELRADYGKNVKSRFFLFYMMQAASNVLLALPFLILYSDPGPVYTVWVYAGFVLWPVAWIGVFVADGQLSAFRRKNKNKGEVCNVGLWKYSRHPNYFFESMIWVAYALMATSSPVGWLAWLSPAIILFLLLKVTGIPLNEKQSLKSKGEKYRRYQRTTSKFVPWFRTTEH